MLSAINKLSQNHYCAYIRYLPTSCSDNDSNLLCAVPSIIKIYSTTNCIIMKPIHLLSKLLFTIIFQLSAHWPAYF